MLCLALQAGQKLGMILPFEVVLKLKLPKNHFNTKCAPKILFLNEKKIRKVWMIFDIINSLWKSNFSTCYELAKLGKASQDSNNPGLWLILQDLLRNWVGKGVASDVKNLTI